MIEVDIEVPAIFSADYSREVGVAAILAWFNACVYLNKRYPALGAIPPALSSTVTACLALQVCMYMYIYEYIYLCVCCLCVCADTCVSHSHTLILLYHSPTPTPTLTLTPCRRFVCMARTVKVGA